MTFFVIYSGVVPQKEPTFSCPFPLRTRTLKFSLTSMVVEMVPLKGGIGGIVHPPIGRFFTTYIPLIVLAFWGVKNATYHLLGEPETTIDNSSEIFCWCFFFNVGIHLDKIKGQGRV